MNQRLLVFVCIATIAMPVSPSTADDIRLRTSVRLAPDATEVRLADIAQLDGPQAQTLGDVVIETVGDRESVLEITVGQVRTRLQDAGANWGVLNLSGNTVVVRPRPKGSAAAPMAMTARSLNVPRARRSATVAELPAAAGSDAVAASTLLGSIARAAVEALGIDPADLRLAYDPSDEALLTTPVVPADVELTTLSSFRNDKVNLNIRIWSGGELSPATRVVVRPTVRTTTAVLRHDVRRGDPLAAGDFEITESWLSPTVAAVTCSPADVPGQLAKGNLDAGVTLRRQQIAPPLVVKTGDRVIVRCRVGGAVLSLQAEARSDARVGEVIELRKIGERTTFTARVTDRGEAVIDLSL